MLQLLRTPFESIQDVLKLVTGLFSVLICVLGIQRQMYSKHSKKQVLYNKRNGEHVSCTKAKDMMETLKISLFNNLFHQLKITMRI